MISLTSEQLNDVMDQDLNGTWTRYKVLCIDYPELEEELENIKYGYDLQFNLLDYLRGRYQEKPKQQVIQISGHTLSINDFEEELDKREAMMKKLIIDTIQPNKIITSRLERET